MIKLKIGDNYLITNNQMPGLKQYIVFMMTSFNGSNKIAMTFDPKIGDAPIANTNIEGDYIKAIKEERPRQLYILINNNKHAMQNKVYLPAFMKKLREELPAINLVVIKIDNELNKKEFKLGSEIYDTLRFDDKSILKYLNELDDYKTFATRYKNIPAELKVIKESIAKLKKEKKITDRIITLDDLKYLDMIDDIEVNDDVLVVHIKPLPINPSEPLGKCIPLSDFENNKYLARAAEHIYKGGHFGMVGTKIVIRTDFRPEFIETLDHTWDSMFRINNWSNIGYPHFGVGHLCGGEFNDVMAHTAEHGLEYYFMCLKQYLTTANMRDYAGKKIWWYPIYNDKNELVYSAPLDILKDMYMARSDKIKKEIENMDFKTFMEWEKMKYGANHYGDIRESYKSERINNYSGKDDMFLEYCKIHKPDLYKELTEGAEK